MNIGLWILQILFALHTAVGAIWKFSHSAEQTMPTLKMIPQGIWLTMSVVELLVGICLIVSAFYKPLGSLVPFAALIVVAEMLVFCGIQLSVGGDKGPMVYWLVVAVLGSIIAYGRYSLRPL